LLGTVRRKVTRRGHAQAGHPLGALLETLRQEGQVLELTVPPLAPGEIATLAGQLAGHPLDLAALTTLVEKTQGNPLFVVELLRGGFPSMAALKLAPRLENLAWMRLAQRSPLAQFVAQRASVIGREFSFTLLAHLCRRDDWTETELLRGLEELQQ